VLLSVVARNRTDEFTEIAEATLKRLIAATPAAPTTSSAWAVHGIETQLSD
jgi:hypothetical protein